MKYSSAISDAQIIVEGYLIDKVIDKYTLHDLKRNKPLLINAEKEISIVPDYYSEENHIIGEVHSHLGKLKPAQKHKVASDILKMILFDRDNSYAKMIVVCSEEERDQLTGGSYLAEAIRQFNIKIEYFELEQNLKIKLAEAMKKQNLLESSKDLRDE